MEDFMSQQNRDPHTDAGPNDKTAEEQATGNPFNGMRLREKGERGTGGRPVPRQNNRPKRPDKGDRETL